MHIKSHFMKSFFLKFSQFRTHVTSVLPLPNDKWRVKVTELPKDQEKQYEFDALFICNG